MGSPPPYGPPPGHLPLPPPRPVMPPPRPTWGHPHPGAFAPPPYPMAPPRRSNSGPVLALVLGGVVVLGLGAIGVFSAVLSNKVKDTGYSNYTTYSPTYTYTSTTTTTTTTTTSTRTSSTRAPSTQQTPVGPKAIYKLADHPIFSTNIGANDFDSCPLPRMEYSPAGEKRFLEAALPCIEKAWQPALKAANLPYQPAELQVFTGTTQTPCGSRQNNTTAMFCRGVIYWPGDFYANEGGSTVRHPGVYLGQLSHEYGHHVQWLTGMLRAADQAQYDVGGFDTPKGLELNRRLELQATCLGGMTLAPFSHKNVVPMEVVNTGLSDAGKRGDYNRRPDHGSAPNNDRWVMHGHKQNKINACNTWAASSADVS
ncbi:neutral zinc metallopeptidase [Lentzea sp. NPDC051208]|uniref:neutral zinc metallopeptidase n=1 Tax=Lentzea sp. NPDC051208 TaxID=3154642 RepID=UPI003449D182